MTTYKNNCETCKKEFEHKNYYEDECNECINLRCELENNTVDEKLINPKFKIVMTYNYRAEIYDGYCWNVDDEGTEKIEYPLLLIFTNADLDDDGEIDIDNKKLKVYMKRPESSGNGYRNRRNTYLATKVVVRKKERIIDIEK